MNFAADPLPAGFFGPVSDPFSETVCFTGIPLATDPYSAIHPIDTIMRRLEDSIALNPTESDTIDIEIVALSLVSVAPITVTFNGGMNPTDFDVLVSLSAAQPQTAGTMTITVDNLDGGTFNTSFDVIPKFRFTPVLLGPTLTLDPWNTAFPVSYGNLWARTGGVCGFDPVASGIVEIPPGLLVDGNYDGVHEYTTVGTSTFYPQEVSACDVPALGAMASPVLLLVLLGFGVAAASVGIRT